MEEISLFMSICWASSRTHIPYFGKRGVTLPNDPKEAASIWWRSPYFSYEAVVKILYRH